MELILVRLTPPVGESVADNQPLPSPDIVADILWANAAPDDRLEHLRARQAPDSGSIDLSLFHRTGSEPAAAAALALCQRTIRGSPALLGWSVAIIRLTDELADLSQPYRGLH